MPTRRALTFALFACLSIFSVAAVGCGAGSFMSSGASAKLASVENANRLNAAATTSVYAQGMDASTMDFYLSDLPPEVWRSGGDVSAYSGSLIQIHMFISPKAGATPIANTASTATVRWLVLSRGHVGMYGGGGFLTKSGDSGDSSVGGRINDGSLQLLYASPGFEDRLGPSDLWASFDAKLDASEAAMMARALAALAAQAGGTPSP